MPPGFAESLPAGPDPGDQIAPAVPNSGQVCLARLERRTQHQDAGSQPRPVGPEDVTVVGERQVGGPGELGMHRYGNTVDAEDTVIVT